MVLNKFKILFAASTLPLFFKLSALEAIARLNNCLAIIFWANAFLLSVISPTIAFAFIGLFDILLLLSCCAFEPSYFISLTTLDHILFVAFNFAVFFAFFNLANLFLAIAPEIAPPMVSKAFSAFTALNSFINSCSFFRLKRLTIIFFASTCCLVIFLALKSFLS